MSKKFLIISHPILSSTDFSFIVNIYKQDAVLSQAGQRDAPYVWVHWKVSRVPEYAHGYFSRNF